MSSFELLELFGVTITDTITVDGEQFDPDTMIVTSTGLCPISVVDGAEKTRTIAVDFAPEDGAVAGEMRGGERPEWKQMLAQSANELAVIRVVQAPNANADEYAARLFLPPSRLREIADEHEQLRRERSRDDDTGMASMWMQKEVS